MNILRSTSRFLQNKTKHSKPKPDAEVEPDSNKQFWIELKKAKVLEKVEKPVYMDLISATVAENQLVVDHYLETCNEELVNIQHRDGWTPLMSACVFAKDITTTINGDKGQLKKVREYPIIKKLLKAGANIMAQNKKGETALMLAAAYGHHEVIEILIEWCDEVNYKAYANMQDNEGKTALHYASIFHQYDAIDALLEYSADPNAKDDNGLTPLMIVCGADDNLVLEHAIRSMLVVGGNPTLKNNEGKDCLDFINGLGFKKLEQLLSDKAKNIEKEVNGQH